MYCPGNTRTTLFIRTRSLWLQSPHSSRRSPIQATLSSIRLPGQAQPVSRPALAPAASSSLRESRVIIKQRATDLHIETTRAETSTRLFFLLAPALTRLPIPLSDHAHSFPSWLGFDGRGVFAMAAFAYPRRGTVGCCGSSR